MCKTIGHLPRLLNVTERCVSFSVAMNDSLLLELIKQSLTRDMRKMEDDTGMDERDQDEIGQPLKVVVGQTGRSILTKRRRIRSEDDEYVPSDADEEDEEKEEGEKEKESALDDQRGVENEMDQIAHTALHPYYLRSLKRPGAYAGT